jgi:WD40 repeat protein
MAVMAVWLIAVMVGVGVVYLRWRHADRQVLLQEVLEAEALAAGTSDGVDGADREVADAGSRERQEPATAPVFKRADIALADSADRLSSTRKETLLAGWPGPIVPAAILPVPEAPRRLETRPRDLSYVTSPLQQVAASSDGRLLATTSWGLARQGELVLWDLEKRSEVWIVQVQEHLRSLAFSPDGERLAMIGGPGRVQVRRTRDGELESEFTDTRFTAVAFSSDALTLAVTELGGAVRLYEVAGGELQRTLAAQASRGQRPPMSPGSLLSFLQDNTRLLVLDGRSAVVKDVDTGEAVRELPLELQYASAADFSPETNRLAVAGWSSTAKSTAASTRLWDLTTGEQLATLSEGGSFVYSLAITADGRAVAAGDGAGRLLIWTADLEGPPQSIAAHSSLVTDLAFLQDPQESPRIATVSIDRTLKVWQLSPDTAAASRTDDADAASVPEEAADEESTLHAPLLSLDRLDRAHADQPWAVWGTSVSPAGDRLASTHADGTVRLRDVDTGEIRYVLSGRAVTPSAAFVDNGRRLVSILADQSVVVTDLESQEEHMLRTDTDGPWSALACSAAGTRLVAADQAGICRLWDVNQPDAAIAQVAMPAAVSCLAFSADDTALAMGLTNGEIHLKRLSDLESTVTLSGHTARVTAVAFSPAGDAVASASEDLTLRVWDPGTGRLRRSLRSASGPRPPQQTEEPQAADEIVQLPYQPAAVAFSSTGRWLAAGGTHGGMELWESASGAHVQSVAAHLGTVNSLTPIPGEDGFISGGQDSAVRRWTPYHSSASPQRIEPGLLGGANPPGTLQTRILDETGSELLVLETAGRSAAVTFGPVPRDAGLLHAARGQVKLASDADATVSLQIDYYDSTGRVVTSISPGRVAGRDDVWQLLGVDETGREVPDEAVFVGLTLFVRGAANIRVQRLELVSYEAPGGPKNLLFNGGVETIAGDIPRGWSVYERNNPQAAVRVSDSQPREGRFCLHLSGNGDWVEAHSPRFTPQPGETYLLTGYVRASKGKVGLQITYWDAENKFLGKSFVPPVTPANWQKVTLSTELEKYPETATISGSAIARGDVEAWLDDLQLTPADSSSAARVVAAQQSTTPSSAPIARSDWSLSHDGSGTVNFTTLEGTATDSPVLQLKGTCKWAVLSSRERVAIEPGRRYVLTGGVRRLAGEALLKIDYYADRKLLGRTYSATARSPGEWEALSITADLSAHPQATHVAAAAVGRGALEAQFRDLQLKVETP